MKKLLVLGFFAYSALAPFALMAEGEGGEGQPGGTPPAAQPQQEDKSAMFYSLIQQLCEKFKTEGFAKKIAEDDKLKTAYANFPASTECKVEKLDDKGKADLNKIADNLLKVFTAAKLAEQAKNQ